MSSKCYTYTPVANCSTHTAPNTSTGSPTCTACNDGFELVSGACNAIVIANCIKKDSNGCTQCKDGYYLVEDKTNNNTKSCILIPSYIKDKCANYTSKLSVSTIWSNQECSSCDATSYPVSTPICVLKDNLKYLNAQVISASNLSNCAYVN